MKRVAQRLRRVLREARTMSEAKVGRPLGYRLLIVLIGEACSEGLTISPQNGMQTTWNGAGQR